MLVKGPGYETIVRTPEAIVVFIASENSSSRLMNRINARHAKLSPLHTKLSPFFVRAVMESLGRYETNPTVLLP